VARRGEVGRTELESWLRPAALIGREGVTPPSAGGGVHLVIGAPNAVSRERIATRLLPAVREALAATIGTLVEVSVVVAPSSRGVEVMDDGGAGLASGGVTSLRGERGEPRVLLDFSTPRLLAWNETP
jgi:hypothetical protein